MFERVNKEARCSSSAGKHRKTIIETKKKKKEDFYWILVAEEGKCMLCSLCHKHTVIDQPK